MFSFFAMMKITPTLAIIFLFSITSNVVAQMDGTTGGKEKGNTSFGIITAPAKEVTKPKSLDFNSDSGFKTAHNDLQKELEKQRAKSEFENKGILTRAKIAEERHLKAFKQVNGMYQYPVIDQDLGSFRTKSGSVNIICRDYQYPDGDRVTIYINDVPVVSNLTLKQRYQSFNLPLDEGINTIKIVALNQGTSGPNTAAFKIYNDAGMLISSNEWNLATAAKATIIVAKE